MEGQCRSLAGGKARGWGGKSEAWRLNQGGKKVETVPHQWFTDSCRNQSHPVTLLKDPRSGFLRIRCVVGNLRVWAPGEAPLHTALHVLGDSATLQSHLGDSGSTTQSTKASIGET